MKKALRTIVLILYFLGIFVILGESLVPGEASAAQSDKVSDSLVDIIDTLKPNIEAQPIRVKEIIFPNFITVPLNKTYKIEPKILPENATANFLQCKASSDQYVTIEDFVIYPKKVGKTRGTIFNNEGIEKQFEIEVVDPVIIEINDFEIVIDKTLFINGDNKTTSLIKVKTNPIDGTIENINYNIRNKNIVSIIDNVITPCEIGSTIVDVTLTSGENIITKSFEVNVKQKKVVEPFKFSTSFLDNSIYLCDTAALNLQILSNRPLQEDECIDQSYTIEYHDNLCRVDENGILHPLKLGNTWFTVCSRIDPTVYYNFHIEICPKPVEKVEVDIPKTIKVGYPIKPIFKIYPEDATHKEIYVELDGPFLTIAQDGIFYLNKIGDYDLLFYNEDRSYEEEIKITVVKAPIFPPQELDNFRLFVRKTIGHFGAFFVVGILGFFAAKILLDKKRISILLSLGIGFLCSIISELFQLIPDGRCCTMSDMMIDFLGYLSATLILFLFYEIFHLIKKRRHKNI